MLLEALEQFADGNVGTSEALEGFLIPILSLLLFLFLFLWLALRIDEI